MTKFSFGNQMTKIVTVLATSKIARLLAAGQLLPATVMINDPFLRQCMVVDDERKEFFVSHRQLRASLPDHHDETAQDDTNEEYESPPTIIDSRPPVTKKRCPQKQYLLWMQ